METLIAMSADGRVVHIKLNLSEADAYDDLFPPSLFTESENQPPGVASLPEDTARAAGTKECTSVGEDAFEDVEEVNPFVGKTQVCVVFEASWFFLQCINIVSFV